MARFLFLPLSLFLVLQSHKALFALDCAKATIDRALGNKASIVAEVEVLSSGRLANGGFGQFAELKLLVVRKATSKIPKTFRIETRSKWNGFIFRTGEKWVLELQQIDGKLVAPLCGYMKKVQ